MEEDRPTGRVGEGEMVRPAREDSHDLKTKGTERSISHVTHM